MKRHFNIFFLLFCFTCIGLKAKPAIANSHFNASHSDIVSNVYPISSMDENSPAKKQVVILFRNGIEGKNIFFFNNANAHTFYIPHHFAKNRLVNAAWIKYILSFSGFLLLSPEFLFSFSFRPPPLMQD